VILTESLFKDVYSCDVGIRLFSLIQIQYNIKV